MSLAVLIVPQEGSKLKDCHSENYTLDFFNSEQICHAILTLNYYSRQKALPGSLNKGSTVDHLPLSLLCP